MQRKKWFYDRRHGSPSVSAIKSGFRIQFFLERNAGFLLIPEMHGEETRQNLMSMRYLLKKCWWWMFSFLGMFCLDFSLFLSDKPHQLVVWLEWGSSVTIGSVYLCIGMFAYLFGRKLTNRFFCSFCFFGGGAFSFLPSAVLNSLVASAISLICSAGMVLSLNVLFCLFPLATGSKRQPLWQRPFLTIHAVMYGMIVLSVIPLYLHPLTIFAWLRWYYDVWFLIEMSLTFVLVLRLVKQASTEKDTLSLLLVALTIILLPFLLLTLLPQILHIPAVSGEFSSLSFIVLPYTLLYVLLRFKLIVIAPQLRTRVSQLLMQIGLVLILYPIATVLTLWFGNGLAGILTVTCIAFISMGYWEGGHAWIEKNIFGTFQQFRLSAQNYLSQALKTHELPELASLAKATIQAATGATSVCLFLLDDQTGIFASEAADLKMLEILFQIFPPLRPLSSFGVIEWLSKDDPLLSVFTDMPVCLRDLVQHSLSTCGDLAQQSLLNEICIAPLITSSSKIVGLCVLAHPIQRGPEWDELCENLSYLMAQLVESLDSARKNGNTDQLWINWLVECKASQPAPTLTRERILHTYASYLSLVLNAGSQVWITHSDGHLLWQEDVGSVPSTFLHNNVHLLPGEGDWEHPYFFTGRTGKRDDLPPMLQAFFSPFPFAWLPLVLPRGERCAIVVVYTHVQAHLFSEDERAIISAIVDQCVQEMLLMSENRRVLQQEERAQRQYTQWVQEQKECTKEVLYALSAIAGCQWLLQESPDAPQEFLATIQTSLDEVQERLTHMGVSSEETSSSFEKSYSH